MKLALGSTQKFFRLGAVAGHIVVIGRASAFHFRNRFLHMIVHRVQIMPIVNSLGESCSSNKR